MADDEGPVERDGSGDLLGLEHTPTEKTGLISPTTEDSNPQSFGSPLLGTNIAETAEKLGKSSQRRSPKRACYDSVLRFGAHSQRSNLWKDNCGATIWIGMPVNQDKNP